jgi:pimeloyl-ACP methyl ester carboxylesterase
MPSVLSNGIRIEYAESGRKADPVILLIMGLGTQLVAWPDSLCEGLVSLGFRVVRFDHRDVGYSTKVGSDDPEEVVSNLTLALTGRPYQVPYRLRDMMEDTLGLLDALGIERAHIAGISLGGMIAQILAAEHPDRVASLTLLMTSSGNPKLPLGRPDAIAVTLAPRPDGRDREAVIAHTMNTYRVIGSPGFRMSDAELRAWVERMADRVYYPIGAGRHVLALFASGHRLELIKRIRCPTHVVHGLDDPLIPVEAGKELAELIEGATLQLVPGMGHDLAEGLMPIWVDAIGRHCLSVGELNAGPGP